jgi:hypothetical protein
MTTAHSIIIVTASIITVAKYLFMMMSDSVKLELVLEKDKKKE